MVKVSVCLMLLVTASLEIAHASPIYADGDAGPRGAPDGLVNVADLLVASQIVTGQVPPTELEYAHADVYPIGAPDGVINVQDLLLIQQLLP